MRSGSRRGQARACLTAAGSRLRGSIIGYVQILVTFLLLSLQPSSSTAILGHDTCETDAQCLNGGFCVAVSGSFKHCYCSDGYGGNRCEQYCPLLCQNGGVCHPNDGEGNDLLMREEASSYRDETFVCKCLGYFTGKLCDVPYENCSDGRRCLNGGQCVDGSPGSSSCFCQPNFFGSFCEAYVYTPVGSSEQQSSSPPSPDIGITTTTQHVPASSQPPITDTENVSSNTSREKTQQTLSNEMYPDSTPLIQNQRGRWNTQPPLRKSPPSDGISKATRPVPEKPTFFSKNKLLFTVFIGVTACLLTVATALIVRRRRRYRRVKSRITGNESDQPYLWHCSSTDGSWKFVV